MQLCCLYPWDYVYLWPVRMVWGSLPSKTVRYAKAVGLSKDNVDFQNCLLS